MRVISKKRLREFWQTPNNASAEGPLTAWYNVVNGKTTDWQGWGDVRAMYGTADTVGNCVVFDIGGNKWRLITRIHYPSHVVCVLKVMTHEEYDKKKWIKDCGCMSPPPGKKTKERRE